MARAKAIVAYGTDADRQKLAKLADMCQQSQSEWLISMIRSHYSDIFGTHDASTHINSTSKIN